MKCIEHCSCMYSEILPIILFSSLSHFWLNLSTLLNPPPPLLSSGGCGGRQNGILMYGKGPLWNNAEMGHINEVCVTLSLISFVFLHIIIFSRHTHISFFSPPLNLSLCLHVHVYVGLTEGLQCFLGITLLALISPSQVYLYISLTALYYLSYAFFLLGSFLLYLFFYSNWLPLPFVCFTLHVFLLLLPPSISPLIDLCQYTTRVLVLLRLKILRAVQLEDSFPMLKIPLVY